MASSQHQNPSPSSSTTPRAAPAVPSIDVDAIMDALVRRRTQRAIARAMEVIEGSFYVNGRYIANSATADAARTGAAEATLREAIRQGAVGPLPATDNEDDVAAYARAVLEWNRRRALPTHTLVCSWCSVEGAPAEIHAGNPALPMSHGICPRHAIALLEHAGICAEDVA